jgi:hypothetical protein
MTLTTLPLNYLEDKMANSILAGEPLSRNDLLTIVQILEQSFDYYENHNPSFFPEYLQTLRTFMRVIGVHFFDSLGRVHNYSPR